MGGTAIERLASTQEISAGRIQRYFHPDAQQVNLSHMISSAFFARVFDPERLYA